MQSLRTFLDKGAMTCCTHGDCEIAAISLLFYLEGLVFLKHILTKAVAWIFSELVNG